MSGPTVSYEISTRRTRESRLTAPPPPRSAVAPQSRPAPRPPGEPDAPGLAATTSIARQLALAHHIERLVEAGELKDYSEAGDRLGMCKSHVTHVLALLQLAPDIQAAILDGRLMATEHALRPVCRLPAWDEQRAALASSEPATIAADA